MKITDEMVERGARAIATRELGMGDAAGVVASAVNSRWKEFSQTARAALTAALSQCEQEPVGCLTDVMSASTGTDGLSLVLYYGRPVTHEDRKRLLAAHNSVAASTDVRAQTIREEATFLLERLDDFERNGLNEDYDVAVRDWNGHVSPPIARLRALLEGQPS